MRQNETTVEVYFSVLAFLIRGRVSPRIALHLLIAKRIIPRQIRP